MDKLKYVSGKTRGAIENSPKLIVPLVLVFSLAGLSAAELVRADSYIDNAESYESSIEVLELKSTISLLSEQIERGNAAVFCRLDAEKLLRSPHDIDDKDTDNPLLSRTLLEDANRQSRAASPSPAYNSLLQYLPQVRLARQTSVENDEALKNLIYLTSEDNRTSYCMDLVNVLREVYFIRIIKTPQGVGSLHVGQLDNFRSNINEAQDSLLDLTPPNDFIEQHTELNALLNDVRINLHSDDLDVDEFSRRLQDNYEQLDFTLRKIGIKSGDLADRQDEIILQAHLLE